MLTLALQGTLPTTDPGLATLPVSTTFPLGAAALVALLILTVTVLVQAHMLRRRGARADERRQIMEKEIAELKQAVGEQNRRIDEMQRNDPMTGLGNRRMLSEDLPGRLNLARRAATADWPDGFFPRSGLAIYAVGIDSVTGIIDKHGIEVGNAMLEVVVLALRQLVRSEDLLIRLDTEKLLLVANGITREGVVTLAEKLMAAVASARISAKGGGSIAATASVGFCPYPFLKNEMLRPDAWPQVVELAEKLLGVAEAKGRSRACGLNWASAYSPEIGETEALKVLLADPESRVAGLDFIDVPYKAS
jgi:diguanylate cyclase (GGDEF)-like protein